MRVMSSYCIRIAKNKLSLCIRTVSFGSSLDCSCLFMFSLVSVDFKRAKVLIRLNDDKVLRYRSNILLFIVKKKKKKKERKKIKERRKKKNIMFVLNIAKTPYHTCPKKFKKSFIYLFIYLKLPGERHSVTTLITALVHTVRSDFG